MMTATTGQKLWQPALKVPRRLRPAKASSASASASSGVLMAALLVGCGGGGGGGLVPASKQQQHNVMVIDQGIDVSVPDLQGKVAGAYTEVCADSGGGGGGSIVPDGGPVDGGPVFDSLKDLLIIGYGQTDDSCHLMPGIVVQVGSDETDRAVQGSAGTP